MWSSEIDCDYRQTLQLECAVSTMTNSPSIESQQVIKLCNQKVWDLLWVQQNVGILKQSQWATVDDSNKKQREVVNISIKCLKKMWKWLYKIHSSSKWLNKKYNENALGNNENNNDF